MERTQNSLTGSLHCILLPAAAFTLLGVWLTCFAGGMTQAATVAEFNPADYKVCGVTVVKTADTEAQMFAIIEYLKSGKQGMYQPGDMLSGARITGIDKDSVTLVIEEKKHVLPVETAVQETTATAVPPDINRQVLHRGYNPPAPVVPELTIEEVLKNIEQEQSEQKR